MSRGRRVRIVGPLMGAHTRSSRFWSGRRDSNPRRHAMAARGMMLVVNKRAWVVAAVVLALGFGFTGVWLARRPPAASPHPTAASATISGTFVAIGGPTASRMPLTGCLSVTLATLQGALPGCSVHVDADGTFSVAVKPGPYAVFGWSPMFNGGHTGCPPEHNPVRVRAGAHVVIEIVCQMK